MAPEKANMVNRFLAWAGTLGTILMAAFWIGGFYQTTSANNKTLPEHIEEDKKNQDDNKSFQSHAMIKLESLTVSLNYLAKEIERQNNIEEKYHNKHESK